VFARLAHSVDALVRQPDFKAGNSNKPDPCASAKKAFQLGLLVQQRDRAEAKHFAWQKAAERFQRWQKAMHAWKGKKLPYSLGVFDFWLLIYLIDYLGVGRYVNAQKAIQSVASLFNQ
jgi:hypothetical protein